MLEKDMVTELSAVQSWNRKPSQSEILRCELKNKVGMEGSKYQAELRKIARD